MPAAEELNALEDEHRKKFWILIHGSTKILSQIIGLVLFERIMNVMNANILKCIRDGLEKIYV